MPVLRTYTAGAVQTFLQYVCMYRREKVISGERTPPPPPPPFHILTKGFLLGSGTRTSRIAPSVLVVP